MTLRTYLERQREWSLRIFGAGRRTIGITRHIEKELLEIQEQPDDLTEWIDVMILAFDGYWRHGGQVADLMARLVEKQDINFARRWPPQEPEDVPTEHLREAL